MGILQEDKKSRKRKRDKSSDESLVREHNSNKSGDEDILAKDIDLSSPEQKSSKKRKKTKEGDSVITTDVETPIKSKEKVKRKSPVESIGKEKTKNINKEEKNAKISPSKEKKSKKDKNKISTIEKEVTEKIKQKKNKDKGEKDEEISPPKEKQSKKNKNRLSSIELDEDTENAKEKEESAMAKKKKVKKDKKLPFGVVDSKLLEKSGGEVTSKEPNNKGRQSRINRAIDYLHLWKKDKKSWKFNKNFQSLLMKAIYNPVIIDEDDFETSLLYFADCQGGAREKLRTDAMALIKEDDHLAEPVDADMEKRAREILQMLG